MVMRLLRHGEYFSQCGDIDETPKAIGAMDGIVSKFEKNHPANSSPSSLGFVTNRYDNAIEYTNSTTEIRGAVLLFGLISLGTTAYMILDLMDSPKSTFYFRVIDPMITTVMVLGFLTFFLWSFRFECFRPFSEPTIFDRKHKKIFRLFRTPAPGLTGLFKSWPMCAVEYEWDLTEAWHTTNLVTAGSNVTRYHHLQFVVRKSSSDRTAIDIFTVGNALLMNERNVPMGWEHIRRFMEDSGPHLQANDELCLPERSRSLWVSMGAVGPFGARFLTWWRQHPIITTLAILVSPALLPLNVAWGFCHWLSCITAYNVRWPDEVLDAIGSPLNPATARQT